MSGVLALDDPGPDRGPKTRSVLAVLEAVFLDDYSVLAVLEAVFLED